MRGSESARTFAVTTSAVMGELHDPYETASFVMAGVPFETPITWQATVFALSAETGITRRNVLKQIDYQSFQEIELVGVDARKISGGTREGGGHSNARWIELSINQRVLRFL